MPKGRNWVTAKEIDETTKTEREAFDGNPEAQYRLGWFWEHGYILDPQSNTYDPKPSEALYWYQEAANQGYLPAKNAIELLLHPPENKTKESFPRLRLLFAKAHHIPTGLLTLTQRKNLPHPEETEEAKPSNSTHVPAAKIPHSSSSAGPSSAKAPVPDQSRQFEDPLYHEIMVDPITISSGITYERAALLEWAQGNGKQPNNGFICPMSQKICYDDIANLGTTVLVKNVIAELPERNPALFQESPKPS